MVFQTQMPISLVIGIQDLYMTKYKYTVSRERTIVVLCIIPRVYNKGREYRTLYMVHVICARRVT